MLRESLKHLLTFFSYREIVFELNRVTEELHNQYSQNYNDMLNSYTTTPIVDQNCVNLNNIMEEEGLDTESLMMPEGLTHYEFREGTFTPEEIEAAAAAAAAVEEEPKTIDIVVPKKRQQSKKQEEKQEVVVKVEKEEQKSKKTIRKKRGSRGKA